MQDWFCFRINSKFLHKAGPPTELIMQRGKLRQHRKSKPYWFQSWPKPDLSAEKLSVSMPTGRKQKALRKLGSLVRRFAAKYRLNAEVTANSSAQDVVRVYRRLAKKVHPDKPGGNTEDFQDLDEAYRAYLDADSNGRPGGAAEGGVAPEAAAAGGDDAPDAARGGAEGEDGAQEPSAHEGAILELAAPRAGFVVHNRAVLLTYPLPGGVELRIPFVTGVRRLRTKWHVKNWCATLDLQSSPPSSSALLSSG